MHWGLLIGYHLFLVLFFIPDISMIGYIFGNKIGAYIYNFIHHRGISIMLYLVGIYVDNNVIQLIGIILFSHSSFDRLLGYGLKTEQGFKYTHLGKIGHDKVELNNAKYTHHEE